VRGVARTFGEPYDVHVMMDALKALIRQPYWVIALILGAVLVALPSITINRDYLLVTHPPSTLLPVAVGLALLVVSAAAFTLTVIRKEPATPSDSAGLDLTRVTERDGVLSTSVGGCEIRVVNGRIEDYPNETGSAIVLPCNEYFDDRCAGDTKSALGAYVNKAFDGQVAALISLIKDECTRRLGAGTNQQKTTDECAESFGAGRCVLLVKPLGRSIPIALVSTTTQRANQGLAGRISYLFGGMRELVACLADARLDEAVMPVLGAGHGRIDSPLAFVGLLLAVAEAARYGQGGQRLKRVTIVVFRRNPDSPAEVSQTVVRRALALIGS
jgi:hypothetical protein